MNTAPMRRTDDLEADEVTGQLPHPIPYQGSKRALAPRILAQVEGRRFDRLFEPFVGSGAITLAAASRNLAEHYVMGDSLVALVDLWRMITQRPERLTAEYAALWEGQREDNPDYYFQVRDAFNETGGEARLLYLLARCVKNAPRFNGQGGFNQSHDKRRLGMRPQKMVREIEGAYALLHKKVSLVAGDFEKCLADATPSDLVYMDPPWQGTTDGPHKRYHQGLGRDRLVAVLRDLNRRHVPFVLSYDGRCGEKSYGEPLPTDLDFTHFELEAGRSSQATLVGREENTVESLYVSNTLLGRRPPNAKAPKRRQLALSL